MTKPLATSRLLLALALAILFSCTEIKRDNPLDPDGINFVGYSSSSSDALSSGSSSSGEQDSSSSEEALSSSLDGISSPSDASSSSAHSSSSAAVLFPCGTGTYDPDIQFCLNGNTPTTLCGGKEYEDYQFCVGNEVYDKCSGRTYDVTKNICCANDWVAVDRYRCCYHIKYEFANSFCYNNTSIEDRCGSNEYDLATQFCDSKTVVEKCGGNKYNPSTQFCHTDGEVYNKCNGREYDPAAEFCTKSEAHPEVVPLCEGKGYDTKHKFCYKNTIYDKCGGILEYDPVAEFCHTNGITYSCDKKPYNPATQFCYENSTIGEFCGNNPQKSYNPISYGCKQGSNGIYLKGGIDYGGENYDAVLIGEQTWMAENLNYNASGSNTYGRLYDWSTAMGFPQPCNLQFVTNCEMQIQPKHQGICPSGWHIPSDNDWNILIAFVHSDNNLSSYTPDIGDNYAGKYLKGTSGWNSSGNGEDTYGFSAPPGGLGYPDGYFYYIGDFGYWWSSSEYDSDDAYSWFMYYSNEDIARYNYSKSNLFSVRCVKD